MEFPRCFLPSWLAALWTVCRHNTEELATAEASVWVLKLQLRQKVGFIGEAKQKPGHPSQAEQ